MLSRQGWRRCQAGQRGLGTVGPGLRAPLLLASSLPFWPGWTSRASLEVLLPARVWKLSRSFSPSSLGEAEAHQDSCREGHPRTGAAFTPEPT